MNLRASTASVGWFQVTNAHWSSAQLLLMQMAQRMLSFVYLNSKTFPSLLQSAITQHAELQKPHADP